MKMKFFQQKELAISVLLALGLALTEVPLWMSLFAILILLWKWLSEKVNVPVIPKSLSALLGGVIFLIVYIQYRSWVGQEESATVLIGLTVLTILNFETQRDYFFVVLLGFLILVLKSFFSLDLVWIVPSLLSYFGLWFSLINSRHSQRWQFLFWNAVKSVPLMMLLFIFFPRLVLFQTARVEKMIAKSGFSEDLNPGQFSEVSQRDDLAFRATFDSAIELKSSELYWRGSVLTESHGMMWKKGTSLKQKFHSKFNEDSLKTIRSHKYQVILEPTVLRVVFVLDQPIAVQSRYSRIDEWSENTFKMSQVESQQVRYEGVSYLRALHIQNLEEAPSRDIYLQHPKLPPRTQNWIDQVRLKSNDLKVRLRELENFFADSNFEYTLSPEAYQNDLDQFLFIRKKGYCEHYAAAFATLARALGVPARIVIGYQGGLYNKLGQFWSLTQKDAHAWVEIKTGAAWFRYDPTSLISPLRLTLGAEKFNQLSEEEKLKYSKLTEWNHDESYKLIWSQVTAFFDNINYHWTVFLLNYDIQTQLKVLNQLKTNWAIVSLFLILLFLLMFLQFRKRQIKNNKLQHPLSAVAEQIYQLAQLLSLPVADSNSIRQVLIKLAEFEPQWQQDTIEFNQLYEESIFKERPINEGVIRTVQKKWSKRLKQIRKQCKQPG